MLLPVNNGLLLSEPTCKSNKPFSIINKSSTGEGGIAEAEASGGVIGPGLLISECADLRLARSFHCLKLCVDESRSQATAGGADRADGADGWLPTTLEAIS